MAQFNYSATARKALRFFNANLEEIEAYKALRLGERKCAYIYYEEYDDEEGYDEFHLWEGTREDFKALRYNVQIDLEYTEADLYNLMLRYLEHESF